MNRIIVSVNLLGVLSLAGCATNQMALDHANNGVALTTGLTRELAFHDRRQSAFDEIRKRVIAEETLSAKSYLQDNTMSDHLYRLSGESAKLSAYQELRALAELADKIHQNKTNYVQTVAAELDALMKQPAAIRDRLAVVEKSLAALGTDLDFAERLKLVTSFLQEVRTEIDNINKAADGAAPK